MVSFGLVTLRQSETGTTNFEIIIFNICLGAGSRVKENLTSVGFEPTISGSDLPMLYRLSYEASTGAGRGNLGSESR